MATLFGICNEPLWAINTGVIGADPHVIAQPAGAGYGYRRSDDHHLAFGGVIPLFGAPGALDYATTTFTQSDDGQVRCDYVTRITSATTQNFLLEWGAIGGAIEERDARVTINITDHISTAIMFPEVPTSRWLSSSLLVTSTISGGGGPTVFPIWQFKMPLPLSFSFEYDESAYTIDAGIPHFNISDSDGGGGNGRFVHRDVYYSVGGVAECAVDATQFSSIEEEQAHNSLSFALSGGATSTTFSTTRSVVTLDPTDSSGLGYSGNSEVGGGSSGGVYFPAITRISAQYVEAGKLHVDATSTASPTAPIVGVFLRNTSVPSGSGRPVGVGGLSLIDHFEVDGAPLDAVTDGLGIYVPTTVFDIVFKDDADGVKGYIQVRAVTDMPTFPPSGDTLAFNWGMAVQALLYFVVSGAVTHSRPIVRPYGELKSRPGYILAQHEGQARFYSFTPASGQIDYSDDEGETYTPMANAWTGISGAKPLDYATLPHGGACSIAKVGSDIKFRRSFDSGVSWEDPVTACSAGSTLTWGLAVHSSAGKATITITNGTTTRVDSDALGEAGSWSAV